MSVSQQQGERQSDPHAGLHGLLIQYQTVVPVVASLYGTSPCMMPASADVQVIAAEWQGSRGDTRLLARLGLSQAGFQDQKDAQEKALAAKNRWRRKSSTKGQCWAQVLMLTVTEHLCLCIDSAVCRV